MLVEKGLYMKKIMMVLLSWVAYGPLQNLNIMTSETLIINGSEDSQVKVTEAERIRTTSHDVHTN